MPPARAAPPTATRRWRGASSWPARARCPSGDPTPGVRVDRAGRAVCPGSMGSSCGSPFSVGKGCQAPGGEGGDGAGAPADGRVELRTSEGSAPGGAPADPDRPPGLAPPDPPAPAEAIELPGDAPDAPPAGIAAAARVADTVAAARPATVPRAMPAATGADAACSRWSAPKCGEPPSRAPAKLGAFQQRNMSAHTVRKTDQSSLKVISGPANWMLDRTGSMTAVTSPRTMSFTLADTTAPMAFSARNLVGARRPKGRKIPASAAKT